MGDVSKDFYLHGLHPGDEAVNKDKHTPECKWHKDWHACDCGAFDEEEK